MVTTKVGMSKSEHSSPPCLHYTFPIFPLPESTDGEFDDYQRNFALLETAADKFLKDTKTFTDAVNSMCRLISSLTNSIPYRVFSPALFTAGGGLAQHFSVLFHPIASEYDLLGKFPQAAHTIKNVDAYHTALEELRASISPELELIQSRVVGPVKEFQSTMKAIRKVITKREHKVSNSCILRNLLSQSP
jgi:amphiphysin